MALVCGNPCFGSSRPRSAILDCIFCPHGCRWVSTIARRSVPCESALRPTGVAPLSLRTRRTRLIVISDFPPIIYKILLRRLLSKTAHLFALIFNFILVEKRPGISSVDPIRLPLLAQSGHATRRRPRQLLGAKQTSNGRLFWFR